MEEGVETIDYGAFAACDSLTDVYVPRSVSSMAVNIFHTVNDTAKITIHGYAGSYAETWATESNINFEVIEE